MHDCKSCIGDIVPEDTTCNSCSGGSNYVEYLPGPPTPPVAPTEKPTPPKARIVHDPGCLIYVLAAISVVIICS